MKLEMLRVSTLEKIFCDRTPQSYDGPVEGFRNERISFQIAFRQTEGRDWVKARILFPEEGCVSLREIRQVPVNLATYEDADDNYLGKGPGMYPDLLCEERPYGILTSAGMWYGYWVDVLPEGKLEPGSYPLTVQLMNTEEEVLSSVTVDIRVLPEQLPEQKLIHTKWFYCDCLAQAYHVEPFSEEHWKIVENYVRCAVEGGINMILMPVHTPPLDTRVGTERLTTQLVDVHVENGKYTFGMEKVHRWIAMCKRSGVKYYEVAHLFTQWGAQHAPKIMGRIGDSEEMVRLFGWETSATGEEYGEFLKAYIPALLQVFREEGIDKNTFWHISDEPSPNNLKNYEAAKNVVAPMLEGYEIMDALSNFAFYQQGVVRRPVVAMNHMDPFLEAEVPGLWAYYCCGQYIHVPNMFISMPSSRNRILGVLLYVFKIQGFLQWGFNFYNAMYSDYPIDPYAVTDAEAMVPAGDPFQVYPGPDGQPRESLRMAVTRQAMYDLRALQLLETLSGSRDKVLAIINEGLEKPLSFTEFPKNPEYLLNLRVRVNEEILKLTNSTKA